MSEADITSWHVSVAAESFAAGLFARCGLDVSVQYGPNQPEYDLVVVRGEQFLKISVKGSKTGSWGLTQSHLQEANYHGAADTWLDLHQPRTVFCLVQFKDVALTECPRVYLATPREIATRLKETSAGRGGTILYKKRAWGPRAHGTGTVDQIPESWGFSIERIEHLINEA